MNAYLQTLIDNGTLFVATHHGKHPDGRHKIMIDDKRALMKGVLSHIVLSDEPDTIGQVINRKISVTPNFQPNPAEDTIIEVIGLATGNTFLLTGTFRYLTPSVLAVPKIDSNILSISSPVKGQESVETAREIYSENAEAVSATKASKDEKMILDSKDMQRELAPMEESAVHLEKLESGEEMHAHVEEKRMKSALRANTAYLNELADISADIKAGLDPYVRHSFIVRYLRESRATLYRKMKQDLFPKPVKRDRGSFWPMSQIEAYKRGEYKC